MLRRPRRVSQTRLRHVRHALARPALDALALRLRPSYRGSPLLVLAIADVFCALSHDAGGRLSKAVSRVFDFGLPSHVPCTNTDNSS